MFKFLFGRYRKHVYRIFYTVAPGTFVLEKLLLAENAYDANRIFDQTACPGVRRLPNSTRPL